MAFFDETLEVALSTFRKNQKQCLPDIVSDSIAKSFIKDDKNSNLPNNIITNKGTISYFNNFKYLGSTVNDNLRDDNKISTRIQKANGQFGSLKIRTTIGKTLHLHTKINLFNAIIKNTVL